MRIPRGGGYKALKRVVRMRSSTYDLTRPSVDSGGGRFGESTETETTVASVSMWLHEPNEIEQDTEYGDRLGGDLQGLAHPSADIQTDDRLTHGGDEYEVSRIMHLPDNERKVLKQFSLERRTNEDDSAA